MHKLVQAADILFQDMTDELSPKDIGNSFWMFVKSKLLDDTTKKISETEVRTLMETVQEAPSWANQQPTKYYVAISPEKLAAVQNLVGGNKERITSKGRLP